MPRRISAVETVKSEDLFCEWPRLSVGSTHNENFLFDADCPHMDHYAACHSFANTSRPGEDHVRAG